MSAKKPSMSDSKRRSLLCEQGGQLIRGVKIEWSSVHGPGQPFGGGFETPNPNHALKAGEGKKN
jgi:hypothetical protein